MSEVKKDLIDVAQFPGAHCGLFEVAMMAPFFRSSAALIIAPPSCLYHAKLLQMRRGQAPNSNEDHLYLLTLKQEDMIFGVDKVIEDALEELDRRLQPEIIFLISTCTPEIIGFDGVALKSMKDRMGAKLLVVKTNGYSCLHQQKGRSDFLASLIEVMNPVKVKPHSVNIIGLRSTNWKETELVQVLERAGVDVNSVLPGAGSLSEIESAPAAALNIAVGKAAKQLTEKMKEQFGTPYLSYEYSYLTEQIIQGYKKIGIQLGVNLEQEVTQIAEKHLEFLEEMKKQLEGVSFAIGSVEGSNIEAALFYTNLGMKPQFLQTRMPVTNENPYILELKQKGIDLPVIHLNKVSRLEELLNQYHPQIFIGHGLSELLQARNVSHCHPSATFSGPGFLAVEQELENIAHLIKGGMDCE
ncbi:nitrogenase molybdenum-iron protein, alpha and beta chains [Schinkia azotoformans MEV2011]|uniref:Nitrogenase molybdenum-iron protein, alpha and beta chains n=1 Tax=Schinkia azotoformans MEV2011 TaxID=1348973 RepID=A0A072NH58_SCHAZ|nr:nitrogenase component 1 [Schinkia azotoformans]KEF36223.1 nitrogenase molybdenum-iron protein, alpha and beta chains [Schinkia azotoformans MEV2011]MEC1693897.1 nitrogenase component 1 [Schinkia azotoformans]MEC1724758.1 nitrogenase component 1 [Schinkia azotoformans]MEC1770006.1 nitrogenase component 1 [Schinkia azotoformans]MEC1780535.1 nitrogenase component 1 [Schinkia azotoformans]